MTSTTPASDGLRRTRHGHSASAFSITHAVDATEINLEPRPRRCSTSAVVADKLPMPMPSRPPVGSHNFEKIRILGAGSTGRVYLVRSVGLGEEAYYAMKVVKKSELIKRNRVQRILTERQILSVANHPFVVTLHYCFQTADYFYLVMQYCAGGELFSFLRSQENHRMLEAHARFYAAEVLIALEYLHLLGIIYRDLKPENVLVHESGHVMLSDFDLAHEVKPMPPVGTSYADRTNSTHSSSSGPGSCNRTKSKSKLIQPLSPTINTTDATLWFRMRERQLTNQSLVTVGNETADGPAAKSGASAAPRRRRFSCPCVCLSRVAYPHIDTESHMEVMEKRTSFVGTHEYVAPEIIAEEGYVGSVDWWAFGILLYEMLFGRTPFRGQTQIQTLENILDISEEIEFPPDVPISDECKDLIQQLLNKDMHRRLQNPLLIKSHPFFKGVIWPLIRHQQPPIIPAMVHSLQEKPYSEEEMVEFDDEVPYHQALSPQRPRRKSKRSSKSSLASTTSYSSIVSSSSQLHLSATVHEESSLEEEAVKPSLDFADINIEEQDEEKDDEGRGGSNDSSTIARRSRDSSSMRADAVSAYVDQSGAPSVEQQSPSWQETNLPDSPTSSFKLLSAIPRTASFKVHVEAPPSPPDAVQAPSAPASPGSDISPRRPVLVDPATATVTDFEYVSNQQRSYWSSLHSHKSLTAKLSQMDLAAVAMREMVPEEGDGDSLEEDEASIPRNDEDDDYGLEGDEVLIEGDDDDEEDTERHEPLHRADTLAGGVLIQTS